MRRQFSREFKLEAIRLVREEGLTPLEAGQRLEVRPSQIEDWIKSVEGVPRTAPVPPPAEDVAALQAEVRRLRREKARLEAELAFAKKAAAFFAKESR
jgi:transposase